MAERVQRARRAVGDQGPQNWEQQVADSQTPRVGVEAVTATALGASGRESWDPKWSWGHLPNLRHLPASPRAPQGILVQGSGCLFKSRLQQLMRCPREARSAGRGGRSPGAPTRGKGSSQILKVSGHLSCTIPLCLRAFAHAGSPQGGPLLLPSLPFPSRLSSGVTSLLLNYYCDLMPPREGRGLRGRGGPRRCQDQHAGHPPRGWILALSAKLCQQPELGEITCSVLCDPGKSLNLWAIL